MPGKVYYHGNTGFSIKASGDNLVYNEPLIIEL